MQRVLHSILTSRLLLNLREAACQDRVELASRPHDTGESDNSQVWTTLSSVVIGADAWFQNGPV